MPRKTQYNRQISAVIPAARQTAVNEILLRLGYGPDTFSIPLRRTPVGPITHYGCSWQATALQERIATGHFGPGSERGSEKLEDFLSSRGYNRISDGL